MTTKSALIVGIDSSIAKTLAMHLQANNWQVYGTTRRENATSANTFYLDLNDPKDLRNITGEFDAVYLCAAVTNMQFCEDNPELSKKINLEARTSIAKHLINRTKTFISISTSAVFDGTVSMVKPNTKPCPKNTYGLHHSIFEQQLLELATNVTILRASKVVTSNFKILNDWKQALLSGKTIEPFNDITVCPVIIENIVALLKKMGEQPTPGIFHISGEKDLSYAELAKKIALKLQAPLDLIKERSFTAAGINPKVAFKYSSLDMQATSDTFGILPTKIEELQY